MLDGKMWVQIECTDVQNRLLRKAFEKLRHPIDKAQRVSFAGLSLKGMIRGQYRYLDASELRILKKLVALDVKEKRPHE